MSSRLLGLFLAAFVALPLLAACESIRPIVPNNGGGGAGGGAGGTTSTATGTGGGTGGAAPDGGP